MTSPETPKRSSAPADRSRTWVRWRGRPNGIAPVVPALRFRLRGKPTLWTTDDGAEGPCGLGFFVRELPRYLWFRTLSTLTRGVAALLPKSPAVEPAPDRGGRLVIVVAILPDLSHTFVYREILQMVRAHPEAAVVCLERGDADRPVHPEAAALLEVAEFVAHGSTTLHFASMLGWMLTHPIRSARALAPYGSRRAELFDKVALYDPRHPGRGFALADHLTALRPGHVHVYGSTYPTNVVMEASALLDVPFSITSYVDFDFDYDFKLLREKFDRARFFRVCTGFCRTRMGELIGADPDRVPRILFGLDLERWDARPEPDGTPVLLSAARIVEKKGLHFMPPALAKLAAEGLDFEWRVAGDGPDLEPLQELVREHGIESKVRFLGPIDNDAVRAHLREAHLAVLPCIVAHDGERDGIPIFFTEAMATGVAVLSTPVSGIPEVVRDGDTGYLVTPEDVDALADGLRSALTDAERRRAIAERGRQEILDTHDVRQSADTLYQCIQGVRTT